ncbi:MAG: hypothetical protein ACAI25_16295, partial [Planctomycetota bacterium]
MIRSVTLIARRGESTSVITMRPDGHVSAGTTEGALAKNDTRELAPADLAKVFELAALPLDVATIQGGGDDHVTLTINGARRRQFAWPIDERPADPRLVALIEAIEAVK